MPIHVFKFIWSQCVCQCDVCVSAVKRIECKAEVTRVCSRAHAHTFTQLPVSHAGYDGEVESVYLNKMMKTHAPHNLPLTSWEVSVFFFFVSVRWVANSAENNNLRLLLRMHRHTMKALLCCFCWMIGMNTVRFFFHWNALCSCHWIHFDSLMNRIIRLKTRLFFHSFNS